LTSKVSIQENNAMTDYINKNKTVIRKVVKMQGLGSHTKYHQNAAKACHISNAQRTGKAAHNDV
jgi:hypothetical protein